MFWLYTSVFYYSRWKLRMKSVIYCNVGVNSFKKIYSKWGFHTDPYEKNISGNHTMQPSFLVGQMVQYFTKVFRVIDPNENIKAYGKLLAGIQQFSKESILSKVLVPTLTRKISRGPAILNHHHILCFFSKPG